MAQISCWLPYDQCFLLLLLYHEVHETALLSQTTIYYSKQGEHQLSWHNTGSLACSSAHGCCCCCSANALSVLSLIIYKMYRKNSIYDNQNAMNTDGLLSAVGRIIANNLVIFCCPHLWQKAQKVCLSHLWDQALRNFYSCCSLQSFSYFVELLMSQ